MNKLPCHLFLVLFYNIYIVKPHHNLFDKLVVNQLDVSHGENRPLLVDINWLDGLTRGGMGYHKDHGSNHMGER